MTHMQQNLISSEDLATLGRVKFMTGSAADLTSAISDGSRNSFDEDTISFLNEVSAQIRSDKSARNYPDVVTFGFFVRKASVTALSGKYKTEDGNIHIGRGITFHIAPSNVPVNYAYSLVAGLVTGNVCIIRIPSKDFPQVDIINRAIKAAMDKEEFAQFRRRIFLVRYERDIKINDIFSKISDVRIIWGGDRTIEELRKSPLAPRATEITFADRYSLSVINSDEYVKKDQNAKERFADDFYNDTYLTDQNACTSPRIIAWTGNSIEDAKTEFWKELNKCVAKKYTFQPIMGINKITTAYMLAAKGSVEEGGYSPKVIETDSNILVRVQVAKVDSGLMDYKGNSGYFYEYDCEDILELRDICDDTRCQTIGYLGQKEDILRLLTSGIKGVDRVVPIGKTMDFDLIWDGYNLTERLTRTISV